MKSKKCNSKITTGHWKGWPCGNNAQYKVGYMWYCYAHAAKAMKDASKG